MSIFLFSAAESKVIESDEIQDILSHTKNKENVLVVFDIDNTLIVPENPAFQMPNVKERKGLVKKFVQNWTEEEFSLAISLMGLEGHGVLLDTATPKVIRKLQDNQIKCIALTALNSGIFHGYPDTFSHRAAQLNKHGIDFSHSCPNPQHIRFTQLKPELGHYPEAKNGILYSNGELVSKADVLLTYLENSDYKPSHVVFIDDKKEHVEKMSESLDKKKLSNVCIYYQKINSFSPAAITDEELVRQWELLDENAKKSVAIRAKAS